MKGSHILTRRPVSFILRLFWLLMLAFLVLQIVNVVQASPSLEQGATIHVNALHDFKLSDDGECTLREAIIAANSDKPSGKEPGECVAGSSTGIDIIYLDVVGTYSLFRSDSGNEDASQTGDLDILGNLDIVGGPGRTIDGSGITDRVFHIFWGNVTITGVTIKNGGGTVNHGAGIYNHGGNLTLERVALSGNVASHIGGGIYNAQMGTLTVVNSTVSGNTIISDDDPLSGGGGIFNKGSLTLNSSTISGNTVISDDGAPSVGGGIVNYFGTTNLHNTIIAGNNAASARDCYGTLFSQGYNLIQDTLGCTIHGNTTGNIIGQDPLLGPLQDNGGGTLTQALLSGSPAIDAGENAACPLTDQRGEPRPMDGDANSSFVCDMGAFEVGRKRLVLLRAFPDPNDGGDPTVHGLLDGVGDEPLSNLDLRLYANSTCDPANPGQSLTYEIPEGFENTDENGYFVADHVSVFEPVFITAQATDPGGVLLQSNCVPFGPPNDFWPEAVELTLLPVGGDPRSAVADDQYVDSLGQSRWYKFEVEPDSNLLITLGGVEGPDAPLPADFDLTLYGDLQAAFDAVTNPDSEDLVRLGAQYAGSSYSGSSYSGSSYSGSSYSGSSYSGSSYSGSSYSGSSYSGSSYSGSSYSGSSYSGSSYSGDAYIGSSYSGSSYSGSSYSGSSYSGSSYSDIVFGGSSYSEAYSDAQSRSLIAVSANGGTVPESIFVRTWSNNGFYYVRVRSSDGEFSLDAPYRLEIRLEPGDCAGVQPLPIGDPLAPGYDGTDPNPTTLILIDSSRMDLIEGSGPELVDRLNALAEAVDGLVLDVNADPRVQFANNQADNLVGCPYAKNLVARSIKDIIDGYRTQLGSSLQYVVLVGGDAVIPSFRHDDNADLARESQFVPPVLDDTTSQAALRLDYFLSQDDYVAMDQVQLTHSTFPIVDPNVAVGRLVETAADIEAVIDAFLSIGGVVEKGAGESWSTLVTGYDFLDDAARAVRDELNAGTDNNNPAVELITPFELPPTDPDAWTADQLRDALLGSRHDLVFLAGHFAGHSALAADYTTELFAAEVANSTVDMENSIIFSVGCHAGYNIVNQHEVPGVPRQPDWAQAFASKGAALIAGTGYQYGETVTTEYSERLYIEFSKYLRLDTGGPVSIGHALNRAKLAYLTQIPQVRGLHEKALLEASIFGLPMLSVDLPGRFTPPADQRVVDPESLIGFDTEPGLSLGLEYVDLSVTSPLDVHTEPLLDVNTGESVDSEYLSGTDGVVTFPTEPFLPLELRNVTVPGTVLRGIGFRGGIYTDVYDVLPLTGAPTTEAIALHLSWQTDYLHPIQTWNASYIGALIDGETRALITPVQHMVDLQHQEPIRKSIRRQFSDMDFRLFYSNNVEDFDGHTPALSAPPSIMRVAAIPGGDAVTFRVIAVGDPAAGIQSVWVTWTELGSGVWQSLDLTQRETDTTLWEGTLPLNGIDPQNIRCMVQAVNWYGRIGLATNFGRFFTPGVDAIPDVETVLMLDASNPSSGLFDESVEFSAVLETIDGQPLEGQSLVFRLGPALIVRDTTDSAGRATVNLNLLGLPGATKLYAAFEGTAMYQSSSDVADFAIEKQQPVIKGLEELPDVYPGQDSGIVVQLVDQQGEPLREQSVFIVLTNPNAEDPNAPVLTVAGITNLFGQVSLGTVDLPAGQYLVTVYYNDLSNPLTQRLSSDAYGSAQAVAMLTVLNTPPVAVDDAYSVDEDQTLIVDVPGVLANDDDADGHSLTAVLASDPSNGALILDADGSFTYVPEADFNGTDSFTYQAYDGFNLSNIATVNITVNEVNDPPTVAVPIEDVTVFENAPDTVLDLSSTFLDVDAATNADSLSLSVANDNPSLLTASIADTILTLDYAADQHGTANITVRATDLAGAFVEDTFLVTVNAANNPPDCTSATPSIERIWPPNRRFWPVRVRGVTDPDGDPVTITIDRIFQDEWVGWRPDAWIVGPNFAKVRAERAGKGDGRVYHIEFEAEDDQGGICSGVVLVGIVPHDQSGEVGDFDSGPPWYDSITGEVID
jgi:CSLREA domain-containing protein